ncbi:Leukocyte antigen CD37 [Anabarilius grahami]|uniref:Leukocyte antigen CD37 n=1 Tax=Anabarilius grahami TaxID=495550 RepID=A0A3N0XN85_ANAGA|nr:Leukocyte antigen CD37 [Anabarilius grahami]
MGYRCRIPQVKPLLNQKQRQKRLTWATEKQHWTVAQWSLVRSVNEHTLGLIKTFGSNDSSLQGFKQTLEYIQMKTKCCGWEGKQDWGDSIPCSCVYTGNVTVNATHKTGAPMFLQCPSCFSNDSISNHTVCLIYEQGCSNKIKNWLDENLLLILVVILAISVVEVSKLSPNTLNPIHH